MTGSRKRQSSCGTRIASQAAQDAAHRNVLRPWSRKTSTGRPERPSTMWCGPRTWRRCYALQHMPAPSMNPPRPVSLGSNAACGDRRRRRARFSNRPSIGPPAAPPSGAPALQRMTDAASDTRYQQAPFPSQFRSSGSLPFSFSRSTLISCRCPWRDVAKELARLFSLFQNQSGIVVVLSVRSGIYQVVIGF